MAEKTNDFFLSELSQIVTLTMIKNLFSKQNICLSKISVCRGFLSYNPGAISLDFPGREAAKKGAELAGRVLEKGAKN